MYCTNLESAGNMHPDGVQKEIALAQKEPDKVNVSKFTQPVLNFIQNQDIFDFM